MSVIDSPILVTGGSGAPGPGQDRPDGVGCGCPVRMKDQ